MDPRDRITQYVADSIRGQTLFKSVTLREVGAEPAYVLTGAIERMEEVDRGKDVEVVCTISMQLLDAKTKSVVWSHTASQTVAVQNRNVAGVVASLSAAVQMSVDNLVKSLGDSLRATSQ
jgi:hypothetical protein